MTRQQISIGLVAAAVTLGLSSVQAQDRQRPAGSDSVGSAAPRGGDSGSSGSSSGSASSGSSSGWVAAPAYEAPREPARAENGDQRRRGGGTPSSGRATPRGEAGGGSGSTSATAGTERGTQGRSRDGAAASRPRDGRNPVGTAVERRTPVPGRGGSYYPGVIYDPYYSYYYDPYYRSRYSYWSPYGYGYGLGYFSYDPFLFGGLGYPGYYGGGGYDPYYYGGGSSSGAGGSTRGYRGAGALRLKVKPSDAQVYIDGYFVGEIDNFDGVFQRLTVEAGPHRVELRADGYEPVQFEVMITPGDTITYKGEMIRR